MNMSPIKIDTRELTATIKYDLDDLWHLYLLYSPTDGYARELYAVIEELEAAKKIKEEGPGLRIVLSERGPEFQIIVDGEVQPRTY